MNPRRALLTLFIGLLLGGIAGTGAARSAETSAPAPVIAWQPWSDSVFAQAKREHKFVLLDLHAVWCHWCHVMDEKTYADPRVIALINARYLPVSVDQDSRPDLANRYQDYGWPATVVFNADGGEIVKRQGYLPPGEMASMLQAIIDDPTPGPSVTSAKAPELSGTVLTAVGRPLLRDHLLAGYDNKLGGWGRAQKFLNWDNVEWCLTASQTGDARAEKMARQTLAAQLKLIDPVWGGVDQYSAGDDWDHPHFEKIMQMQAENVKIYAEAYARWKDPVYLKTAAGIAGYVRAFLTSPDGAFYVSQDADLIPGRHAADYFSLDDAGRRKLGVPRVDTHVYARENGWFIVALTSLYAATGEARYRDEAARAAGWIISHRGMEGAGFRHGGEKSGPISLGDTLAMARAFLSLYAVTGDRVWLDRAEAAAGFIDARFGYKFHGQALGYATAEEEPSGGLFQPEPDFDENVALARFANLLFHYTGNARDRTMAETALRFAATPDLVQTRLSSVGGLMLADQELSADPLHLAIVGGRDDAGAKKLFAAALACPVIYKQVEWIDPHKAAQPNAIVYPDLPRAAAYVCARQACSAPVFDEEHLNELIQRKTSR